MASPIGNYMINGRAASIVASSAAAPCNFTATNESGQTTRLCFDGSTVAAQDWNGLLGHQDAYGNINWDNGTVWSLTQPVVPASVPTITPAVPATVATATTTATDFLSGTTFGLPNVVLLAGVALGLYLMSDSGGGRGRR